MIFEQVNSENTPILTLRTLKMKALGRGSLMSWRTSHVIGGSSPSLATEPKSIRKAAPWAWNLATKKDEGNSKIENSTMKAKKTNCQPMLLNAAIRLYHGDGGKFVERLIVSVADSSLQTLDPVRWWTLPARMHRCSPWSPTLLIPVLHLNTPWFHHVTSAASSAWSARLRVCVSAASKLHEDPPPGRVSFPGRLLNHINSGGGATGAPKWRKSMGKRWALPKLFWPTSGVWDQWPPEMPPVCPADQNLPRVS